MKSTSVAIAVTFATLVLVAAPAELQDRKAWACYASNAEAVMTAMYT